jgi:hypothetical protein
MRHSRSPAVALVVLAILCPAVAHAQLDADADSRWIDKLSGPGPFKAYGLSLRALCAKDFEKRDRGQKYEVHGVGDCRDWDPTMRHMLEVRGRYLRTYDGPLFSDTPADTRSVKGLMFDVLVSARLNPVVDVGAGIGVVRFWGDGFDAQTGLTLIPASVTVTPFAIGVPPDYQGSRWRRVLGIQYEALYIHRGFSGRDFGNTATSYSTKREYLSSVGIVLDLRALINW